jgi:iron complex outermembrane receptor protein
MKVKIAPFARIKRSLATASAVAALVAANTSPASAQTQPEVPASAEEQAQAQPNTPDVSSTDPRQSAADALLGDVVVTARKRPEDVQSVPLAVTAFGNEQLATLNFRDLGSLTSVMPNVALDSNGTFRGFANFSVRGIGTNSSIPSTDPTVGLFVDGVYQGVGVGQVLDNFDLEAVEVLRGPQGIFFGRNVTGGAIVVRTRKPTDQLDVRGRLAVESGIRVVADASVSGPLIEGKLSAKLAAYWTHDNGYFTNRLDNSEFGEDRQFVIRPALRFTPTENIELLLRYEHGKQTGDGPATQNAALFDPNELGFAINERGYVDNRWDSLTWETNIGTGFGDGTITNIFGWRKIRSDSLGDIDGTTSTVFHIIFLTDQEQFSDELRYAGTFGSVDVTAGLYAFTQGLHYVENRILGAAQRTGGGDGRFSTLGAFAAVDWHFTNTLTLNLGARYSYERKRADIGAVRPGGGDVATRSFIPDFSDTESWRDFTPRIGLQFEPSSLTQVYAFYTKGFRSGGYNFRNTTVGALPGPRRAAWAGGCRRAECLRAGSEAELRKKRRPHQRGAIPQRDQRDSARHHGAERRNRCAAGHSQRRRCPHRRIRGGRASACHPRPRAGRTAGLYPWQIHHAHFRSER